MRLHTGCADASDLLFVYEQAAGGLLRCFYFEHCNKRGVCAYTVILAVCKDHAGIHTKLACFSGRYDLKLCGEEIIFFDAVFVV